MQTATHPDAERLTAYLLGKLTWPEVEQVESHLGACASCQSLVGSMEGRTDSFVLSLRVRQKTPRPTIRGLPSCSPAPAP